MAGHPVGKKLHGIIGLERSLVELAEEDPSCGRRPRFVDAEGPGAEFERQVGHAVADGR